RPKTFPALAFFYCRHSRGRHHGLRNCHGIYAVARHLQHLAIRSQTHCWLRAVRRDWLLGLLTPSVRKNAGCCEVGDVYLPTVHSRLVSSSICSQPSSMMWTNSSLSSIVGCAF